jgi:hypothetical protein
VCAIVERDLFDAVQAKLTEQVIRPRGRSPQPCWLDGSSMIAAIA